MKVIVKDIEYSVWFEYGVWAKNYKTGRVVKCHVEWSEVDGTKRCFLGVSLCSSGDQFVKETGRKIALARAISSFERQERRLFWEAYFSRGARLAQTEVLR